MEVRHRDFWHVHCRKMDMGKMERLGLGRHGLISCRRDEFPAGGVGFVPIDIWECDFGEMQLRHMDSWQR